MKVVGIMFSLFVVLGTASLAQERPIPQASPGPFRGEIRVISSANVPFTGAIAGKAKCDDHGNVYVRLVDSETSKRSYPSTLPIRRINSDGSLATSLDIRGLSADLRAIDFFVSGDGRIFEAARSDSEGNVYVVSSSSGSTGPKMVRLEADFFIPYQIAVFKNGEFLLSGIIGPHNRTPYTAVFDANGKLIRSIYEPEDEDAKKRAELGEAGFKPEFTDYGNDFVTHGDAAVGADGSVYLLRAGSKGLIYVISDNGSVLRKLSIESPSTGLVATRLKSLPGRLAVVFLQKGMNQGVIQVVDYDGRSLNTYTPNDSRMYPGLMGCFDNRSFTFLAVGNDGDLHIHRAEPK